MDDEKAIRLTCSQHAAERRLFGTGDRQLVVALDLDPALGIGAVEAGQRRLPQVGALVALGLVNVVCNGPELRTDDVVGEALASLCCPF